MVTRKSILLLALSITRKKGSKRKPPLSAIIKGQFRTKNVISHTVFLFLSKFSLQPAKVIVNAPKYMGKMPTKTDTLYKFLLAIFNF